MGWVIYLSRATINPYVWTDCKLGYFIYYFCRFYSPTVLTLMSVEKFFALYFPLKTRSICTVKTAKWVTSISALVFLAFCCQIFVITSISALVFLAFCCQIFVIADVRFYYNYSYCKWVKVPNSYIKIITYIDGLFYSFVPFTVMLTVNTAIIYKYLKTKWENRHGTTESTNQALSKSAMKGTAMLITVSVMFLCLTFPLVLSYAITLVPDPVMYSVIVLLFYSNHSINGVLYCIVGTRFRQELVNTLCCRRRTTTPNTRLVSQSKKRRMTSSTIDSSERTNQSSAGYKFNHWL